MLNDMPLLVLIILGLPAVAAIVVASLGSRNRTWVRWVSLAAVLVDLTLTGIVVARAVPILNARHAEIPAIMRTQGINTFEPIWVPGDVDPSHPTHQTTWDVFEVPLSGSNGSTSAIQFYVGLDGLNIWLVALTSFLMLPAVLVSWNAIKERSNEFYAWLLVLQTGMLGVFLSFDIILFYVFFELTLVPLFFVIGIWGGPARREAARKFFLFTLTGSLITLLGMIGLILACHDQLKQLTFSIPRLVEIVQSQLRIQDPDRIAYWRQVQTYVFLALAVGFAVKVPLFPLHTWLPLAHVEAPTAGSVLLAGVLLKLGTYGFLRLCLPLVPDAAISIGVPLIGSLAAFGVVYGALCAFAQNDVKKMVAYSSVSHLGFCMIGLFALNSTGILGSLMQMINHGLSTGGLFLLVGMLYERFHTRMMNDYGGVAARLKMLSVAMVFICLSSVGMPFLNGFIGEMLVLAGAIELKSSESAALALTIVGAAGIVLGAWYLFTMLQRVFFGPLKLPHHDPNQGPIRDLDARELLTLVPVGVACLLIGVYPRPILDSMKRDVALVTRIIADRQSDRLRTDHLALVQKIEANNANR